MGELGSARQIENPDRSAYTSQVEFDIEVRVVGNSGLGLRDYGGVS